MTSCPVDLESLPGSTFFITCCSLHLLSLQKAPLAQPDPQLGLLLRALWEQQARLTRSNQGEPEHLSWLAVMSQAVSRTRIRDPQHPQSCRDTA